MTDKENIIFVDIDGPLLPARQWYVPENSRILQEVKGNTAEIQNSFELKKRIRFDPIAIAMFNTWVHFSKAKVVLSTNWVGHTSVPEILELCLINGMDIMLHTEPVTPKFLSSNRYREISSWVEDFSNYINNFIVWDDDYTVHPDNLKNGDPNSKGNLFAEHVVWVDYNNGTSTENFKYGCNQLGIKERKVSAFLFGRDEIG